MFNIHKLYTFMQNYNIMITYIQLECKSYVHQNIINLKNASFIQN
jgi:hypothetical protein